MRHSVMPNNGGPQVLSGQLVAPELPEIVERTEMAELVNTYGKTIHTWQVRATLAFRLKLPRDAFSCASPDFAVRTGFRILARGLASLAPLAQQQGFGCVTAVVLLRGSYDALSGQL